MLGETLISFEPSSTRSSVEHYFCSLVLGFPGSAGKQKMMTEAIIAHCALPEKYSAGKEKKRTVAIMATVLCRKRK
jgi:hypothetical protein